MLQCVSIHACFPDTPGTSSRRCRFVTCALAALALSACSSSDGTLPLGRAEQPILRGQIDREHPQVMLLANQAGFICTGTLIHVRDRTGFLLTAAHCVTQDDPGATRLPPKQFVVLAGDDFLASSDAFPVEAIRVHPGYDGTFALNDVAIVRLALDDATPPPAIPPLSGQDDTLDVDDGLLLIGYGQTERADENSVRRHVARDIAALDAELIAYSQEDGKGTCFGDSGGPGLVTVRGAERVASVTSGGVDADERCSGGFGVGMRVSAYAGFIESALSGD
ncbi:MAG: trypsin-like serine protease [Deltaproteobacteria bacterium]